METIIKKAIEGGYETDYFNFDFHHGPAKELAIYKSICDPLFWQALGKACGWGNCCEEGHKPLGMTEDMEMEWGGCEHCVFGGKYHPQWEQKALSFHEINLREGWEKAVSYLEDLVK